jgi:hypothetical protein
VLATLQPLPASLRIIVLKIIDWCLFVKLKLDPCFDWQFTDK